MLPRPGSEDAGVKPRRDAVRVQINAEAMQDANRRDPQSPPQCGRL